MVCTSMAEAAARSSGCKVAGACCDGKPRREPSIWNLKKESYWAWLAIRCWPPARNGEVHSRVWSGGNENQHLKIYSHGPQLENDVVPTLGQEQVATLEEFRYLGVLFMSEWEAEQEIHRWLVLKLQSCGRSTGTSWWRESWVDLRPYPHLRSWALGSDWKNEISDA